MTGLSSWEAVEHQPSAESAHEGAAEGKTETRSFIVGIDPGTIRAGWVVLDAATTHVVEADVWESRPSTRADERVADFARWLDSRFKRLSGPVKVVAVEHIPPIRRGRTVQASAALAEAVGAIIAVAAFHGVRRVERVPTKKARSLGDLVERPEGRPDLVNRVLEDSELCDACSFALWVAAS